MRFEIAAAALIAGFAAAAPQAAGTAPAAGQVTSTIMVTDLVTITSCAESVTSCPARTSTNVYAVTCLLYTSPSPRDRTRSRMPSSA